MSDHAYDKHELAQRPKEILAVAKMIIFDYGRTLYDRETDDMTKRAIPILRSTR